MPELKELKFKDMEGFDEHLVGDNSVMEKRGKYTPSTLADSQFEGFTFDKILPESTKRGIRFNSEKEREVLNFASSSMLKAGRIFLNRFSFISWFESIVDTAAPFTIGAWDLLANIVGGSPGVSAGMGNIRLDTAASSGNSIEVVANPRDITINFSKSPAFEVQAKCNATTSQTIYMTMGANQTSPAFAGFKVVNGTLSAAFTNAAGTERLSTISGITLTNWNRYRVIMTVAKKIEWYVNDVLKISAIQVGADINYAGATLSAQTLLTGAGTSPVDFYILNSTAASRQLALAYTSFSQDD